MSGDELSVIVEQWLRFAEEDLTVAQQVLSQGYPPRHACWAAQQAAEKSIKALLIQREVSFPKTHNLQSLSALLAQEERWNGIDTELNTLSEWAVEARYPGPWPEASAEDAALALRTAERIVASMRTLIRGA